MVLYPYRKQRHFYEKDVRYNNGLNSVPLRSFTPVGSGPIWAFVQK